MFEKKAWILWRKHQWLGASWSVLFHTSALIAKSRVKKSYLHGKTHLGVGYFWCVHAFFQVSFFGGVSQDVSSTPALLREVSQVYYFSEHLGILLPICWCSDMLVVSCLSSNAVGVLYTLAWFQKQKEMQKHHFFGRKVCCFMQSLGVRNTSSVAGTSSWHISKTCTSRTLENIENSASFSDLHKMIRKSKSQMVGLMMLDGDLPWYKINNSCLQIQAFQKKNCPVLFPPLHDMFWFFKTHRSVIFDIPPIDMGENDSVS